MNGTDKTSGLECAMPQTGCKPAKEYKLKLEMETRASNDATILHCRGRFTYREEATAFSEKIAELLPTARRIVVDLSGLEAIDSAGLGELVVVHMWVKASGCALKLAGANARVRELFELTNLLSVFDVYPTLDDALMAFQRQVAKGETAVHAA
jgi:anti-sigma B factor antagonist